MLGTAILNANASTMTGPVNTLFHAADHYHIMLAEPGIIIGILLNSHQLINNSPVYSGVTALRLILLIIIASIRFD